MLMPMLMPTMACMDTEDMDLGISIGISISISISRPLAIMKTRIAKDCATNIAGGSSRVSGNTYWVKGSNDTMGLRLSRPLAEMSKGVSIKSISIARISINSWAYITAGKTIWVVCNPETISIITIVSICVSISIGISIRCSISIRISLAKVVWQALDTSVAEAKSSAVMCDT